MNRLHAVSNQTHQMPIPTKAEQLQEESLARLRILTSHPSDRSVEEEQDDAVKRLSHESEAVA